MVVSEEVPAVLDWSILTGRAGRDGPTACLGNDATATATPGCVDVPPHRHTGTWSSRYYALWRQLAALFATPLATLAFVFATVPLQRVMPCLPVQRTALGLVLWHTPHLGEAGGRADDLVPASSHQKAQTH